MHQIIYSSYATVPFEQRQLEQLLTQARAFNESNEVTGILLYGNEQFIQVLEGEEPVLQALYARICQDSRHRVVTTHLDKPIAKRAFANWHMAFQVLPAQQFRKFAGYLLPAEVQFDRPELNATDQQLLQMLYAFLFLEKR